MMISERHPVQREYGLLAWMLALGVPMFFLAALPFLRELYLLAGFAGLAIAIASGVDRFRLMMLIALLPLAHAGFGLKGFGGFGVYDLYGALFLLFLFWRICVSDTEVLLGAPALKYALIMMVAFTPSILNSIALSESLKAFLQLLASILIAGGVYFYIRKENDAQFNERLLQLFVLVATGVGVYGILEGYASGSILKVLSGRAFFSLFQDVNYYSSYLLMAFAMATGLALVSRSGVSKVLYSICAVLLTATIVSTVSRSAIAVLLFIVAAFALYLMVTQRGARKFLGAAVVLLFLSVIAALVFTDVGSKLVDLFTLSRRVETVMSGRDASLEQRMTILGVSQRIIEDHPIIGVGFGAFEKVFDSYQGGNLSTGFGRSAHNTLVRILAETGVIGLIASLIFVLTLIRFLARAVGRAAAGRERTLMFSVLVSIISFFLMSITLDQLFEPHFWVMTGLSLALSVQILDSASSTSQRLA